MVCQNFNLCAMLWEVPWVSKPKYFLTLHLFIYLAFCFILYIPLTILVLAFRMKLFHFFIRKISLKQNIFFSFTIYFSFALIPYLIKVIKVKLVTGFGIQSFSHCSLDLPSLLQWEMLSWHTYIRYSKRISNINVTWYFACTSCTSSI